MPKKMQDIHLILAAFGASPKRKSTEFYLRLKNLCQYRIFNSPALDRGFAGVEKAGSIDCPTLPSNQLDQPLASNRQFEKSDHGLSCWKMPWLVSLGYFEAFDNGLEAVKSTASNPLAKASATPAKGSATRAKGKCHPGHIC